MEIKPKVVTRFAPSPTGFLHIGGARTALFNWLYARHHGGVMRLRIEDTDRARSTTDAIDAILNGLSWLGVPGDDEIVYQSARADRHREVAEQLLTDGKAYRCYATPEELDDMRERARAEGRPPRYDGRWRDRDPGDAPAGAPFAVRLKAPTEGETVIDDAVQGRVTFANKDLDDLIILRSDRSPTYMLAVVVDDHDMGVTQIIRGDDHLTNAARQSMIFDALGWDVPGMAHIPLIHGPDGAKLSKRHGALGVDAYRDMGYLPSALRNYLVRLGWSHGDDEFFTTDEMVELFSLEAVGKSPSRFDFQKLENMNGHYIRGEAPDALMTAMEAIAPSEPDGEAAVAALSGPMRANVAALMPAMAERAKTVRELIDAARFLWAARPLSLDDKAAKLIDEDAKAHLKGVGEALAAVDDWSIEPVEAAVREYTKSAGAKLGKVAQPLRAALTGRTTSPPIFDVIAGLPKEEALGRIADQAA